MNDFISMMAFREEAIKRIVQRLIFDDNYDTDEICRQEGLPLSSMTSTEIERMARELNDHSRQVSW